MNDFASTIRALRVAQGFGLREAADLLSISPAYLSRIERAKENAPNPDIIKRMARLYAADPDVLFRLTSSTDPDISKFLCEHDEVVTLLRLLISRGSSKEEISKAIERAVKYVSEQD
jgi:transcriptional regulator with XRE-family HTH domain